MASCTQQQIQQLKQARSADQQLEAGPVIHTCSENISNFINKNTTMIYSNKTSEGCTKQTGVRALDLSELLLGKNINVCDPVGNPFLANPILGDCGLFVSRLI